MKSKPPKSEPKKVCDCPLSELIRLSVSVAEGHEGEMIYRCEKCKQFRYVRE